MLLWVVLTMCHNVSEKVQQWSKELKLLSAIAITQPHDAFAAYTHGLASKWSYLCHTTPFISPHLKVLEDVLRTEFIPNLTGRPPPNDAERKLLALPARLGGLGISDPSLNSDDTFKPSPGHRAAEKTNPNAGLRVHLPSPC